MRAADRRRPCRAGRAIPQVYAVSSPRPPSGPSAPAATCARWRDWGRTPPGEARALARGGVCAQLAARLLHQADRLADRRRGDGLAASASRCTARIGWPASAIASPCPRPASACFPTTASSWAFARMPDEIGMYLALTGRAIGRADAYRLGLVTHCIPAARFAEIRGRASAMPIPSIRVLDDRHEDPGPGELDALRPVIARCFSADSVEDIVARLRAEQRRDRGLGRGGARGPAAALADLAQDHASAGARWRAAWICAPRWSRTSGSACRFLRGRTTSTRACAPLLIDRDRAPQWQPARLEDVTRGHGRAPISPRSAPTSSSSASRAEMQAVRR